MKRFKDILICVLIGCMIFATPVLAESILTKIDVALNGVNVQVEGEDVEVDSILYNGTTYLPMRKVAELVGKDIEWYGDTMTANIVEVKKEGDIMSEPIEENKIIKEEDNKILILEKNGREFYSWDYISQLERPKGITFFINDNEYAVMNVEEADRTDIIEVDNNNYINIGIEYFISKDYYENTILPLIK